MNFDDIVQYIPSIPEFVFLGLSALAVVFALLMVTRRDAVHSALCLVVVLFQLAGVYVLLNAPFLAVLQVLVYAGAILVLFLFVIMLLQLREGPRLADNHNVQRMTAPLVGLLLAVELIAVISLASTLRAPALPAATFQHTPSATTASVAPTPPPAFVNPGGGWTPEEIDLAKGQPRALGIELYTNFLMPFEIASFILLVAVVGAIVLARREQGSSGEYSTVGITMGRNAAPPDSPQAIEQARVLMGQVPGIRVVRPLEGDPDREEELPAEPVGAGDNVRGNS